MICSLCLCHFLNSLEFQTSGASSVSQSFNTTMVDVAASVENNFLNTLFYCSFSDNLTNICCGINVISLF